MGHKIWDMIRNYFKPLGTSDSFGEPSKMSGFVLFALWVVRFSSGWKIHVNHGYKIDGHSENSQHYVGNAVDFYFLTDETYIEQIKKVETILKNWQLWNFVGLGIYPDWNRPGFHLDARGHKARWGFVGGKQVSYEEARNVAV